MLFGFLFILSKLLVKLFGSCLCCLRPCLHSLRLLFALYEAFYAVQECLFMPEVLFVLDQ